MKTFPIKLGKGKGALTLDAAKLVNGRCLIQGTSGSGKSYLVRVLVEQTIPKHLQTIILDPEGEFATLREKFDVLVAGREGDVPTEVRSAKELARQISEARVSAVVDLSDLKLEERRLFVKLFLDTLDHLPKKLEAPRLVILDEAHKFAPESGKGKATSTEAVITLMSQGRKRGLCGILVTQRLSKLKKDAAAEAANVLIGKTSPIDLHSAQDMLGVVREDKEALRTLAPGEFYATGPALEDSDVVVFQARKAMTSHPEPGSRYKLGTPPPRQAITKILKHFENLPPPKEVEEAQTIAELEKEVRALKRNLKQAQDQAPAPKPDLSAYVPKAHHKAVRKAYEAREKALAKALSRLQGLVNQGCEGLLDQVQLSREQIERTLEPVPEDFDFVQTTRTGRTSSRKPNLSRPRSPAPPAPRGVLPFSWKSAPGKLFTVLLQYHPESLPQRRVAALAGVNGRSSTFRNALTKLRTAGVIGEEGKALWATEEAFERFCDDVEPLPSGPELIDGWRTKLGGVPLAIFDALIEAGGRGSRKSICDAAGTDPNLSTARNAFTKLRNLGLLDSGRGDLQLNEHVLEAIT